MEPATARAKQKVTEEESSLSSPKKYFQTICIILLIVLLVSVIISLVYEMFGFRVVATVDGEPIRKREVMVSYYKTSELAISRAPYKREPIYRELVNNKLIRKEAAILRANLKNDTHLELADKELVNWAKKEGRIEEYVYGGIAGK